MNCSGQYEIFLTGVTVRSHFEQNDPWVIVGTSRANVGKVLYQYSCKKPIEYTQI